MDKASNKSVIVFLTAGVGDNLLTLPLLLELEKRAKLTIVLTRPSEVEFFRPLFPRSELILANEKNATIKILLRGWMQDFWIFPVGSSPRKFRLLHLLCPLSKAIGFTSLAGQKTWQSEIGFLYTLLPDLGAKAWKNNLRLLAVVFPDQLNRIYKWEDYTRVVQERLASAGTGVSNHEPGLALHIGSNKYAGGLERFRRWPSDRFFQLADELQKSLGFKKVYWIVGPGEEDCMSVIQNHIRDKIGHEAVDCVQVLGGSLVRLYHFLAKMQYLIANDSGISHLSTLADLPSTAIFSGIGQVLYTGQSGGKTHLLWEDVECRGCTVGIPTSLAMTFQCPNDWACMNRISVGRARGEVETHWKEMGQI